MSERRPRHLTIAALVLAVAIVAGALASTVPRSDAVGAVDAVLVLGGGAGERLALGRALADERGIRLVLSAEAIEAGGRAGLACEVDVVCLHPDPVNTAGEARAALALVDEHRWQRIAVVTSTFHANRTRTLFGQCLGDRADVQGATAAGSPARTVYRYGRELVAHLAAVTIRRAC